MFSRFLKVLKIGFFAFFILLLAGILYLRAVALVDPPDLADKTGIQWQRDSLSAHCFTLGQNWIRQSDNGLWELFVQGKPFERGCAHGKLAKELVQGQEVAFNEQISELVPSKYYRSFLKYFIGWFNRDLVNQVSEEYKEEIYGVSLSASEDFNYIGSNYQRLLNYHAAHDIGHALQNMALVGCTSFGAWDKHTADGDLIIGRNFDFYVGDKFAAQKIIAFVRPGNGHNFCMITWGGMIGVVSGMNEKGLTVTLNAAKSDIPSGSATPISILAREILQYAQNIDEAMAIAQKRKTFVSESLMIGSAQDQRVVLIEKTPEQTELYQSEQSYLICTNHFKGKSFTTEENNIKQMAESASIYREKRVGELMNELGPLNLPKSVQLLRDRRGLNNADIGMGNEKAVNQLIAHHCVVFQPDKLLVTVSTSPWQLGEMVTYDLHTIFAMQGLAADKEIRVDSLTVSADTFLNTDAYRNFVQFRTLKEQIRRFPDQEIDVNALIQSNPSYYHTYVLAGDYYYRRKKYEQALAQYEKGLTMEIATLAETNHLHKQVTLCKNALKE